MATSKKTITKQKHLTGLALFTMARKHYAKSREFEEELCEIFGYDDGAIYAGCISDEIYEGGNFDRGLEREDFVIAPDKPKRKSR